MRSAGIWRREGRMPITVKTFATLGEAASAMQSDRGARFLGGGTLVMRAINEGDVSISTVVRATDRAFAEIRPTGARVTLGAGVTMAQVIANRELSFLHPVARAVGGPGDPQHGDRRRQPVRALAIRRLHGRAARARCDRGDVRRLFRARDAAGGILGEPRARQRPGRERDLQSSQPGGVSLQESVAGEAEGHLGALDRRTCCR